MGFKEDLAWTEQETWKAQRGEQSKQNRTYLKYLHELKANIEKELNSPPTYETFRSWPKGRPKGQDRVKFWRGRP